MASHLIPKQIVKVIYYQPGVPPFRAVCERVGIHTARTHSQEKRKVSDFLLLQAYMKAMRKLLTAPNATAIAVQLAASLFKFPDAVKAIMQPLTHPIILLSNSPGSTVQPGEIPTLLARYQ